MPVVKLQPWDEGWLQMDGFHDDQVLLLELPLQDNDHHGQGHEDGRGQEHQARLGAGQVDQVAQLKPTQ